MSDYIPLELQAEIIQKLPIKSLIQFRSVSKPWKSLIDSSKFIANYSVHHTDTQPQRILVRYDFPEDNDHNYVSIVDDDTFAQNMLDDNIPVLLTTIEDSILVGSSNGLLCFYGDSSSYYTSGAAMAVLWNPAIRKSVGIFLPNVSYNMFTRHVLGFGVCSSTSDPKLVKITYIHTWKHLDSISCMHSFVEVFPLSSGAWRSPLCSINLPRKSIQFTMSQVVINGFIYWFAYDLVLQFQTNNLIICFDITREEFKDVYLPDSLANQHPGSLSVSSLRGSLVVLEYSINGGKRVCDVWKMEHGVPNLFMKLYTIHPVNESINKVFGFINSGAPVIKVEVGDDEDFEDCCVMVSLALYEPKSKQITAIGIYGTEDLVFLTCYKESLLLLDRPDGRLFNVNSDDDDDDESQSC